MNNGEKINDVLILLLFNVSKMFLQKKRYFKIFYKHCMTLKYKSFLITKIAIPFCVLYDFLGISFEKKIPSNTKQTSKSFFLPVCSYLIQIFIDHFDNKITDIDLG
jgi:hypothetical protein